MYSQHEMFMTLVFTMSAIIVAHATPQDQSCLKQCSELRECTEGAAIAEVSPQDQPTVKKHVDPKYPELAKRAGMEGMVFLKVYIDEQGHVEKAVVDSSTSEVFVQSAITAVKQWEFSPAQKDGKPIKAEVVIPFRFQLAHSPKYMKRDEIMFLQDDVVTLLRGGPPESVKTKIGSSSYAVIGKKDEFLPSLFSDKAKRNLLVEGSGTEVEYSRLALDDSGDMAFLVLKTKSSSSRGGRFHTVVFMKSGDGVWSIVAWHAGE